MQATLKRRDLTFSLESSSVGSSMTSCLGAQMTPRSRTANLSVARVSARCPCSPLTQATSLQIQVQGQGTTLNTGHQPAETGTGTGTGTGTVKDPQRIRRSPACRDRGRDSERPSKATQTTSTQGQERQRPLSSQATSSWRRRRLTDP